MSEGARCRILNQPFENWEKYITGYRACDVVNPGHGIQLTTLADMSFNDADALMKGGKTAPPTCPECAVLYDEAVGALQPAPMPICAPRFLTLAQAQKLHPHLLRAQEVRVLMTHAFAPLTEQPCWQWNGWADEKGYGRMAHGEQASARVHRVTYQLLRGYVLESQVLDHLCRNRLCCNPWHLEPISQTTNTQRGARADGMCRNGLHQMVGDNVISRVRDGLPRYECRACKEGRR